MKQFMLLLCIALLWTTPGAFAGKIYKWIDNDGKVHYGERPPDGKGQQITPPKAPPRAATPAVTSDSQHDATQKLLESFDKDRKAKAEAKARTAKEQEVRAKNCSRARKRVATLSMGRIFEVDDNGERHYLSDAELDQRRQKAQATIEKWCK